MKEEKGGKKKVVSDFKNFVSLSDNVKNWFYGQHFICFFFIYLSELVKAIKDVFEIFKKSETHFSTVNSYNFRDITFEKVRYVDIKI